MRHFREWLSFHAHGERTPPRLTITITLGELPQTWARSNARTAGSWTALLGVLLLMPFTAVLAAGALNAAGVAQPMQWIGSSTVAIVAASVSLFVGIPVALVINLWRIVRFGLHLRKGELDGLVALEFAPLQLIVVVVALAVGALFVGHLAADSYACMNGVRSAC